MNTDSELPTLPEIANRVKRNDKRSDKFSRRILVIAIFVLVAVVVLTLRSERIDRNVANIQKASCARTQAIVLKFNRLQDNLANIEERNMSVTAEVRASRIEAYKAARILPLPTCPPVLP